MVMQTTMMVEWEFDKGTWWRYEIFSGNDDVMVIYFMGFDQQKLCFG